MKNKRSPASRRAVLRWGTVIFAALLLTLFFNVKSKNSNEDVVFTIEPIGPSVSSYKTSVDFGKGRYASFWINRVNEDLIIDTIRIHKEGATDEEMPYVWLRLNGIRSYVRTPFRDNLAIFHIFPAPTPTEGTYELYTSAQEKQKLTLIDAPINFTVSTKKDASVQLYGQFGINIEPREPANGIRFCIEEISGTLAPSGRKASTQLAEPLCFNKMGITQ